MVITGIHMVTNHKLNILTKQQQHHDGEPRRTKRANYRSCGQNK
jgi:hypothetical protein